jgi:hypothetical protein
MFVQCLADFIQQGYFFDCFHEIIYANLKIKKIIIKNSNMLLNAQDSKFNYKINCLVVFLKNKTLTIITHCVIVWFNPLQFMRIMVKALKSGKGGINEDYKKVCQSKTL